MKKNKKKVGTLKFQSNVELSYEFNQKVWFYLSNSLEVLEGRIIGFFATMNNESILKEENYLYQVEYYKKQKDGSNKMYIGNVGSVEIEADKEKIIKRFESTRNKRIDKVIKEHEIELNGAKTSMDFHKEAVKEIQSEINRVKKLKR